MVIQHLLTNLLENGLSLPKYKSVYKNVFYILQPPKTLNDFLTGICNVMLVMA